MIKAQATVEFVLAITLALMVFTILGLAIDKIFLDENQARNTAIDYVLDDFQAKVEYALKSKTDVIYNFTFPVDINGDFYNISFQNYTDEDRSFISIRINNEIKDTYRYLPLVTNYTIIKRNKHLLLIKNDSGVFIK